MVIARVTSILYSFWVCVGRILTGFLVIEIGNVSDTIEVLI